MQGIPMFDDSLRAAEQRHQVLNVNEIGVSPAAQKRMAGNSFHQACMCAFLAFTLASLTPLPLSADHCPADAERKCVASMQGGEDLVSVIADLGREPAPRNQDNAGDSEGEDCCTDDDM